MILRFYFSLETLLFSIARVNILLRGRVVDGNLNVTCVYLEHIGMRRKFGCEIEINKRNRNASNRTIYASIFQGEISPI